MSSDASVGLKGFCERRFFIEGKKFVEIVDKKEISGKLCHPFDVFGVRGDLFHFYDVPPVDLHDRIHAVGHDGNGTYGRACEDQTVRESQVPFRKPKAFSKINHCKDVTPAIDHAQYDFGRIWQGGDFHSDDDFIDLGKGERNPLLIEGEREK
jgi:hypothetical protein